MEKAHSLEDIRLLEALQTGDAPVIKVFYKAYREEFIKWAYKNFGVEEAQAIDFYQDMFAILHKNVVTGKLVVLNSSVKTYLFAIGKNLILDKFKREKRHQESLIEIKEGWHEEDTPEMPFQPMDRREKVIEAVMQSMEKLSESCQRILQLFYFEKLSNKEIAKVAGYENEDVVKNQKMRCMKYLKRITEEVLKASDL